MLTVRLTRFHFNALLGRDYWLPQGFPEPGLNTGLTPLIRQAFEATYATMQANYRVVDLRDRVDWLNKDSFARTLEHFVEKLSHVPKAQVTPFATCCAAGNRSARYAETPKSQEDMAGRNPQ